MVLLYTMYLPYLQAVERVRRRYPDLKACVIVTDLPNELGLASGRKGLLRQIEYKRGRRSMEHLPQDGCFCAAHPTYGGGAGQ